MRQRGLHQKHRPPQVHTERLVPPIDGEGTHRFGECIGGVVHHDVDTAELLDGGPHQVLQGFDIARVRRYAQRPAAQGAQMLGRLGARFRFAACDNHIGACAGITFGERSPDPTGAPGDDGRTPREVEQAGEGFSVHRFLTFRWSTMLAAPTTPRICSMSASSAVPRKTPW